MIKVLEVIFGLEGKDVTGTKKKLHNKELHSMNSSPLTRNTRMVPLRSEKKMDEK
jgi:hypothetical protein